MSLSCNSLRDLGSLSDPIPGPTADSTYPPFRSAAPGLWSALSAPLGWRCWDLGRVLRLLMATGQGLVFAAGVGRDWCAELVVAGAGVGGPVYGPVVVTAGVWGR